MAIARVAHRNKPRYTNWFDCLSNALPCTWKILSQMKYQIWHEKNPFCLLHAWRLRYRFFNQQVWVSAHSLQRTTLKAHWSGIMEPLRRTSKSGRMHSTNFSAVSIINGFEFKITSWCRAWCQKFDLARSIGLYRSLPEKKFRTFRSSDRISLRQICCATDKFLIHILHKTFAMHLHFFFRVHKISSH